MKKLICILLILGMVSWLWVNTAQAATTDTFQITVTCNFLAIVLKDYTGTTDYTTWAIGQQAENTPTTMTQTEGIMVDNTSNVATDLSAWVSEQATNWTNGASAAENVYKLEMQCFSSSQTNPNLDTPVTITATTEGSANEIKDNLSATTDQWSYAKFTTPTSTASGSQQTITVTIKVATHS